MSIWLNIAISCCHVIESRKRSVAVWGLLLFSGVAFSQSEKDSVRWDDRAGQWVYTLYEPGNMSLYKEIRYTPRNLIDPVVKSSLRRDKDAYEYRYRIANGAQARNAIGYVSVVAPMWEASIVKRMPLASGLNSAQIIAISRAESAAEESFLAKTVFSPHRWKGMLNLNHSSNVAFGWLADYQKSFSGVAPRTTQDGFSVLRPELPGAGWMEFKGATADNYNAASLPRTGVLAGQVEQMQREDSVTVAVLLPAIIVPAPYSGVELARRVKFHVLSWSGSGLADTDSIARLIPSFDVLISALSSGDKKSARHAVGVLMAQLRKQHVDMDAEKTDDDDDAHDSKPDGRSIVTPRGSLETTSQPIQGIERVAARALAFDLRYLLERMGPNVGDALGK